MTSVIPEASTATPDTQDQRATEPTALYRLHNTGGTLLYIGVTDNPDRRFQQHRDTKPWWPQVAEKAIEWHPSRDRALAEEATAIKAETPVYNIDRNPAAPSYHWPPTGMPTDRVDTIERVASTLPASEAEGIRRAAFEEFTRAQLDERATAGTPSTPTGQQADDLAEVMPKVFAEMGTASDLAAVLLPEVADRIWAFTVVAHARAEVGDDYGYVLDILADNLRNGRDPQAVRDEVPRVVAKLRASRVLGRIWEARDAADGPWAKILDIVLETIEEGADPQAVIDQVVGLMRQSIDARKAAA
ncbi:GIY-YIG nuclease family protein [Streptomyces scabiei]|uniref:GIY-YIG nuclease family protein n=1 Tax=Streptomyces scabiei TaxID=1930 RepID=UPI0029A5BDD5|nr:GIY-YIG nuclease family protein [Streptomyces scabiei]MDX3277869.1 GIY-YIG nuclease family protein [Streptomyces scabiei]